MMKYFWSLFNWKCKEISLEKSERLLYATIWHRPWTEEKVEKLVKEIEILFQDNIEVLPLDDIERLKFSNSTSLFLYYQSTKNANQIAMQISFRFFDENFYPDFKKKIDCFMKQNDFRVMNIGGLLD